MSLARALVLVLFLASLGCSSNESHDDAGVPAGMGGASGESGGASGAAGGGMGGSGANGMVGGAGGNSGDGSCGPALREPRCFGDWCWDGPWVASADLFAIDGTKDAASVWAVGALGTALRYCGGHWLPIETGVQEHLYDVFSPTNDFAVAVGANGTVITWNGSAWARAQMPTEHTLRAVWGASPSDMWIGADIFVDYEADNLFRFDGTSITETQATNASVYDLRGRSSGDIYAVGNQDWWPTADHFDGTTWTSTILDTDSGLGPVDQLVFAPEKNRTLATYDYDQIIADDGPGWRTAHRAMGYLGALYLDDTETPSIVMRNGEDKLLPGNGLKRGSDGSWAESTDQFTAWPEEVWTGAGHSWAIGYGNALLARGDDGLWDQVPDFKAQLGTPILLGGTAEDDGYLVTDSAVYQRGGDGWTELLRTAETILSASLDKSGNLYIQLTTAALRYYDGSSWHDVMVEESFYGGNVFGFAPDDIWLIRQDATGSHFDGTAWEHAYNLCMPGYSGRLSRMRQAPDGSIWAVSEYEAVQFALPSRDCTIISLSEGDRAVSSSDPLADLAWTEDGQLWAITSIGRLFRRDGETLVADATPDIDIIPGPSTDFTKLPRVHDLFAIPGNKLRYLRTNDWLMSGEQRHLATSVLLTVDATNTSAEPEIEELPVWGPLWSLDDARTFVAFPGGVLSRGVTHEPIELTVGSPGGNADGITTSPVPYEQIFCPLPDITGQTLVVPCALEVGVTIYNYDDPPTQTSRCNTVRTSYRVSVLENRFSWSHCTQTDALDDQGTVTSGGRDLSDSELSALLDQLKVMTLSSATECTGPNDIATKYGYVMTRTASGKYTDSAYGCTFEGIFVDHIDDAIAIFESMEP